MTALNERGQEPDRVLRDPDPGAEMVIVILFFALMAVLGFAIVYAYGADTFSSSVAP